jgi:ADP-heptose:LPS heptosyltransferase
MPSLRRSRLSARLAVVPRAAARWVATAGRRRRPAQPRSILVAHNLLLGDTLMLAPLLAKLRERYPAAAITMTVAPQLVPLFAGRPYGVRAMPYEPRDAGAHRALASDGGYDIAIVPGDNRHALLALAAGARWTVAAAADRPQWKNTIVDELVPMATRPTALADMFASLAGGPPARAYARGDWPAPQSAPFELLPGPYAVLHVGAGSPLRLWEPEKWRAIAAWLAGRGLQPVWSAGPREEALVQAIDPEARYPSYASRLDLAQLWRLLEGARLLVALDTGAMHLAKLTVTPTVALFGPGSHVLFGPGEFWRANPFRAVTIDPFPCRDQRTVFKRELEWVRRCQRSIDECPAPRCMQAIEVAMVERAAAELLS